MKEDLGKIYMTRLAVLLFVLSILVLSGCVGKNTVTYIPPKNTNQISPTGGHENRITAKLIQQYSKWSGTRYKNGGVTRSGVDCSAFVQITYKELFRKRLPRTVQEQSGVGWEISRNNLQPGDLVFFKTGLFQKHVGIYFKNGSFMHASVSKGVTVSKLGSDYWRGRYWKSRRLL